MNKFFTNHASYTKASKILLSLLVIIILSSCGMHNSKVHDQQSTSSDIKIDKFDLSKNYLQLRFTYRSHREKVLENINCDIKLNHDSAIHINKDESIELGAFSTEILKFESFSISNAAGLHNLDEIDYSLTCRMEYSQGTELVEESSALHLVPGSQSNYR